MVPPRRVKGKITASSTLEPQMAYHVEQLFDHRKEFVWVEGDKGNGKREKRKEGGEKEGDKGTIQFRNPGMFLATFSRPSSRLRLKMRD